MTLSDAGTCQQPSTLTAVLAEYVHVVEPVEVDWSSVLEMMYSMLLDVRV
jgi:hypothetical protein